MSLLLNYQKPFKIKKQIVYTHSVVQQIKTNVYIVVMNAKKINLRNKLRVKMLDQMPMCERCWAAYATDLHEVKTRARGGSILDEENIRVLCRACHSWITTNPAEAKEQGWLKNSWDK